MLNVDQRTVREWIINQLLIATRYDGHWQIAPSDLAEFRSRAVIPPRKHEVPLELPLADLGVLRTLAQWDDAVSEEIAQVHKIVPGNARKHLCLLEARGFARRVGRRNGSVVWTATVEGRQWLETHGFTEPHLMIEEDSTR